MRPTVFTTSGMKAFAEDVDQERQAQIAKWGDQHHPDLDSRDIDVVTRHTYAQLAKRWQEINAERATPTTCTRRCPGHPDEPRAHTAWDGVLLEEAYEALAEDDPVKLRTELIQLSAVCAAWVADIDSRVGPEETYPCQIGVFCDKCGFQALRDYEIDDSMTHSDRLGVARVHLTKHEGWVYDGKLDWCPSCKSKKAD